MPCKPYLVDNIMSFYYELCMHSLRNYEPISLVNNVYLMVRFKYYLVSFGIFVLNKLLRTTFTSMENM